MELRNLKHSVVVISYNQQDLVIRALKSIVKQEILPYEIIILDDCSSDQTARLNQLAIKYIRSFTPNPPAGVHSPPSGSAVQSAHRTQPTEQAFPSEPETPLSPA